MSELTARLTDRLRSQKSGRGTDAYLVIPPGDIVSLSVGDPDLPPPAHVIKAAHDALDAGRTRYTHWQGLRELRVALAEHEKIGPRQVEQLGRHRGHAAKM